MITNPQDLVGRDLGGYRLESILGTGGMSAVFLGRKPDRTEAAIKVLLLAWQANDEELRAFKSRFRREAQVLMELTHPQIPRLLGFGEEGDLYYLVLQYINGGTLADRLAQGPLALDETARLIAQIASALDHAHGQGIVHRDIKPANVLLDKQGNAYLTDFSIVHILSDMRTRLTASGSAVGTPIYMSPEQAMGIAIGPASDIYTLGLLAYAMVTGRAPFEGRTSIRIGIDHLQLTPPAPRTYRSDLPVGAEAAILTALAKQPDQRFRRASEFARAFEAGLYHAWSPSAPLPAPPGTALPVMPAPTAHPVSSPQPHFNQAPPPIIQPPPSPAPYLNQPPIAPSPSPPAPYFIPPPPAQPGFPQPPPPSLPRRNPRPLVLVGVAAVALVSIIGVLVIRLPHPISQSQAMMTPVAQTSLIPGPGCGTAGWRKAVDNTKTACGTNTLKLTQLTYSGKVAEVFWDLPSYANSYRVSAHVTAALGACGGVAVLENQFLAYIGYLCGANNWEFYRYDDKGNKITVQTGSLNATGSHEVEVSVTATSVILRIDGMTLSTATRDPAYKETKDIGLAAYGYVPTQQGSATFSNVVYTPTG